ncbi:hypothetical protein PHIM7_316 [Sinorhizobium phage phiM7]|uniref:Uncharacterized protein n=2 Tax=Emdodecavirus TaxID=1980937 RepID=S5MBQ3_9CAUD|nr:hypothetical protein AB690_gp197 [Sinorhizobium phage phiM12]YP_009601441.1 hypothetical protein FDH46_gp162 [Sinorhizobium phage phiM7]AGR48038.1 hypothetical protein SmphiM12_406 [Sinorhizobium phage phiM12]AKF12862.1 hypothetical protein PHIM7_316 [Sinorhizobium phage phiM7]AKF13221.1 hypothetical protein PHIM19_316 [Sinorhizobium phage phiM19]
MIRTILGYCARIQNGRTEDDIFDHLNDEFVELGLDIINTRNDRPIGEDGILGEAIILRKLDKWERIYG